MINSPCLGDSAAAENRRGCRPPGDSISNADLRIILTVAYPSIHHRATALRPTGFVLLSIARGRFARILAAIATFLSCLPPAVAYAQGGVINREFDIKAAYIYNFGKYITWPQSPQIRPHDFVIGVVGDSPIYASLLKVARNKKLKRKRIVIKRFEVAASYEYCDILFVPAEQDRELVTETISKARTDPTLIIGEEADFTRAGGIINFYLDQNKLRFEIRPKAAEDAGLSISSKLLSLGRIVGS